MSRVQPVSVKSKPSAEEIERLRWREGGFSTKIWSSSLVLRQIRMVHALACRDGAESRVLGAVLTGTTKLVGDVCTKGLQGCNLLCRADALAAVKVPLHK